MNVRLITLFCIIAFSISANASDWKLEELAVFRLSTEITSEAYIVGMCSENEIYVSSRKGLFKITDFDSYENVGRSAKKVRCIHGLIIIERTNSFEIIKLDSKRRVDAELYAVNDFSVAYQSNDEIIVEPLVEGNARSYQLKLVKIEPINDGFIGLDENNNIFILGRFGFRQLEYSLEGKYGDNDLLIGLKRFGEEYFLFKYRFAGSSAYQYHIGKPKNIRFELSNVQSQLALAEYKGGAHFYEYGNGFKLYNSKNPDIVSFDLSEYVFLEKTDSFFYIYDKQTLSYLIAIRTYHDKIKVYSIRPPN